MRVFLDTNVVLDTILDRVGGEASSLVIAKCLDGHLIVVSWHSVATMHYLIEKQTGTTNARNCIQDLLVWSEVATVGKAEAVHALSLPMKDYEDAMQVVSAESAACDVIVTRDTRDFKNSPITAVSPEEFLRTFA